MAPSTASRSKKTLSQQVKAHRSISSESARSSGKKKVTKRSSTSALNDDASTYYHLQDSPTVAELVEAYMGKKTQLKVGNKIHRTKILCTFGPAIASKEKIKALIEAGATAFRLNMSHGSHEVHLQAIEMIRAVEADLGIHIPILADVQGPKLRVGDLHEGAISIVNGTDIFLADESVWERRGKPDDIIPVRYPTFAQDVKVGSVVLFDDGLLKVKVRSSDGEVVRAIVENGGLLKSRKGINMPDVYVNQPAMTEKDKKDIIFAINNNLDFIALSFVRTAEDVQQCKDYVKKHGGTQWIIAKIEKPQALENIEKIIDVADGIMVARGDMGVEIPAARVPIEQKRIITLCNNQAKPVITATQMLESMIQNPRPTRAEASDISNAVFDGTDVVMLSAETSVGAYPVEAVSYMRMICEEAEAELFRTKEIVKRRAEAALDINLPDALADAISGAVGTVIREMKIDAIAAVTTTGKIARYMSSRKFFLPIFAFTQSAAVSRRVNLLWGVQAVQLDDVDSTDEAIEHVKEALVKRHYLKPGATVVISIGRPLKARSKTNMLCIEKLK
ncbi:MAG: pyruvate kinase [Bacteroidota bacterium]|nr:pyruvate kinase [Candidatus Kapabacteria bacterium]MDW8219352.1 pyruvate kinase [Bacteroidota bacterium]